MLTITEIFAARVQQAEDRAQPDRYGEWPGMPSCLLELGAYLASRNMLGGWRGSDRFWVTRLEVEDMAAHDIFVGPGRAFAAELLSCQAMGGDPMTLRFSIALYERTRAALKNRIGLPPRKIDDAAELACAPFAGVPIAKLAERIGA